MNFFFQIAELLCKDNTNRRTQKNSDLFSARDQTQRGNHI